jgi:hypothetical protein
MLRTSLWLARPAYRGELAVGGPQTDPSCAVLDGAGAAGCVLLVDAARPRRQPRSTSARPCCRWPARAPR